MPVVSNNTVTSSSIVPLNTYNWLEAYYPNNGGTPWKPMWECRIQRFRYSTISRLGWNFYSSKSGYKNVPYIPSVHNDKPLNYTVMYINNSFQQLDCKGLLVKPNYSGQPIQCPEAPLPRNAAVAHNVGLGYSNLALDSRVRNNTLAKVNGKIMDKKAVTVDWATFIGESRDTRKMMAQRLQQVATTASHLSRGRYLKAWKTLFGNRFIEKVLTPEQMAAAKKSRRKLKSLRREWRTAGNLWLEWSYGWGPLLGTVYDMMDDLRTAKSKPLRFTVRANTEHTNSYVLTQSGSFPILYEQSKLLSWPALRTDYVKHGISLTYEVKDTIISDLTGAGIANPGLVAWELTPWSFVVDWFANVGNYLESQTIGNGLRYICGTESTLRRVTVEAKSVPVEVVPHVQDSWKIRGVGRINSRYERHDFTRAGLSSHPPITLGFQLNPLSVRRAISAAALISQSLSRIFKH